MPAAAVARIGREFADNAERSGGRSMILMGAGTNHWFHSDTTYRAMLALTTLTGCQGVNGGGWAHYVGQEKCRPVTGWSHLAFAPGLVPAAAADDRHRVLVPAHRPVALRPVHRRRARLTAGQGRVRRPAHRGPAGQVGPAGLDAVDADVRPQPAGRGRRGPRRRARTTRPRTCRRSWSDGRLGFACTDPDAPQNWPRVLTVWRANLLGSSAKGNEYFLRHLLGTDASLRAAEAPPEQRPRGRRVARRGARGQARPAAVAGLPDDVTTLFSDVVLPAATWYEKHDLNTTDMHPFIHAFTPAINPPWQTRTDFDAFHGIAKVFSELAGPRLGVRKDLVAAPLLHDTPDALATPGGVVRDWMTGEVDAVPGRTMPKFIVVERDYGAVAAKMGALGPLLDRLGTTTKAVTVDVNPEIEFLQVNGTVRGGVADGRPAPGHRHPRVRGDPRAVRHHQRAGRHRGLRVPGAAHRPAPGGPGRRSTRASRSGSPTASPGRCR